MHRLRFLAIVFLSATAAGTNLTPAPKVPADCAARLGAIIVDYSVTSPSLSIRTPNLRLDEFTPNDLIAQAGAIDAMFGTPEHVKYMSLATKDPARLRGYARDYAQAGVDQRFQRKRDSFIVAVRDPSNKIIGLANLSLGSTGTADFGFVLNPAASGKGYGTEVAYGLVKAAFETFGMREVVADVHVDNVASQRVMEKAGFERTGQKLQKEDADGTWKTFEVWRLTKKRYLELAGKSGPEAPPVVEAKLEPDQAALKRLIEKNASGLASWGKTDGAGRYIVDAAPIKEDLATVLGIPAERLKIGADRSGSALFENTILAVDSGTKSVTLASIDGTRVVVPDGNRRGFFEAPTRTGTRLVTLASGGAPPTLYAGTEPLKLVGQRLFRGSGSNYFFEDKAGNRYTVKYPGVGGGATEVLMNDGILWPIRI